MRMIRTWLFLNHTVSIRFFWSVNYTHLLHRQEEQYLVQIEFWLQCLKRKSQWKALELFWQETESEWERRLIQAKELPNKRAREQTLGTCTVPSHPINHLVLGIGSQDAFHRLIDLNFLIIEHGLSAGWARNSLMFEVISAGSAMFSREIELPWSKIDSNRVRKTSSLRHLRSGCSNT